MHPLKRIFIIITVIIILIAIGLTGLKYFANHWYLTQENRNSELNKSKSKLSCETLPLHCAVRDKNWALLNNVSRGDDRIETLDGWFYTPLYLAIKLADKEAAGILLDKGANPNVFDEYGIPALLVSVQQKKYEIAELLLDHGAQVDVEEKGREGNAVFPLFSPLGYCVTNDDFKCVELLLNHGANVDKVSEYDVIFNKTLVKKISIYEMAIDNSNVTDEIKQLLEKSHIKTLQHPSPSKRSGVPTNPR